MEPLTCFPICNEEHILWCNTPLEVTVHLFTRLPCHNCVTHGRVLACYSVNVRNFFFFFLPKNEIPYMKFIDYMYVYYMYKSEVFLYILHTLKVAVKGQMFSEQLEG